MKLTDEEKLALIEAVLKRYGEYEDDSSRLDAVKDVLEGKIE